MLSSEQILENAARDSSIDIADWPRVLETVLKRLHDIVHNEFPIPSPPPPAPIPSNVDPEVISSTPPTATAPNESQEQGLPDAPSENDAPANSQSSTKENEEPTDTAPRRPPVPSFEVNHNQHAVQPPQSIDPPPGTLPPDLLSIYQTSTHILKSDFSDSPPYTIQRLAEMILYPKKHYRYLPAYLRALDRIISVSSPVSDFPLPTLSANTNGTGFLANGDVNQVNVGTERDGLGSDESLGGALLTPIPWLRNSQTTVGNSDGELHSESTETIEGPNGAGSVETVSVIMNGVTSTTGGAHISPNQPSSPTLSEQSDASSSTSGSESTEAQLRQQGGVTQGELLRQEQEAGVVPVSQNAPRRSLIAGGAAAVGREPAVFGSREAQEAEEEPRPEDVPHARGPDEIGLEDLGPQHSNAGGELDMEAAVGRAKSPPSQPATAAGESESGTDSNVGKAEDQKLDDAMGQEDEIRDSDGDVGIKDAEDANQGGSKGTAKTP